MPERFGSYMVHERLGAGGMATVHRATLSGIAGFERPVALKRLLSHLAHDDSFVRAFVREARIAAHLRHVNVAQTYDLGLVDDCYYIAMELIEGNDLRKVLKQAATAAGPMPPAIVLNLLSQVCEALDYAHALCDEMGQPLGIVHRDVSPANIIVTTEGTAKLIDFGIAKATTSNLMTMSGQLKGKFAYIAPETITGSFDARADLFSLGVVAHELLTATPLLAGVDEIDTLRRVKEHRIPPPSELAPGIPDEVDSIVMTALARDPDERWQSAAAMRGALGVVASRPNLRANSADVGRWIEWAMGVRPSARRAAISPSSPRDTGRRRAAHDTDVEDDEDSVVVERVVEPNTDEEAPAVIHDSARRAAVPPPPEEAHAASLGAAPASSSTLELLVGTSSGAQPRRTPPRSAEAQAPPMGITDAVKSLPRVPATRDSGRIRAEPAPTTGRQRNDSAQTIPSRPGDPAVLAQVEAARARPVESSTATTANLRAVELGEFESQSTGRHRPFDPAPPDAITTGRHRPFDLGQEPITLVDVSEVNILAEAAAPADQPPTLLLESGMRKVPVSRGRASTVPASRSAMASTSPAMSSPPPAPSPSPFGSAPPAAQPLAAASLPTMLAAGGTPQGVQAQESGPQAPIRLGDDYVAATASYAATIMTPVPGSQHGVTDPAPAEPEPEPELGHDTAEDVPARPAAARAAPARPGEDRRMIWIALAVCAVAAGGIVAAILLL